MGRVDAHCHFWDPSRGDYRWLDNGPPALDRLRRTFGPQDLAQLNAHRRVVAVQAADSVAETRYLLDLAAHFPQIAGVVGWVDLTDPRSIDTLTDLSRHPLFKGVRPMLQDLDADDWILTRPDPLVLRAVQTLGLRFDALVFARHLRHLTRFTELWPDLPMIIDHCAKPEMAGPLKPDWLAGMQAMAAFQHVHCKISGLMTELPHSLRQPEAALAALRPVVAEVLRLFGPDRLLWGSDWPVLTLAADHSVWEHLTDRLLEGLTATERAAILGGNAITFYGLERES